MNIRNVIAGCILSVSAASASAGQFTVQGGEVNLDGQIIADQVNVWSGATLRGSGNIVGDAHVSGTLSPGALPASNLGTQTITGDLVFQPGSVLELYAAGDESLDRVLAGGPVTGTVTVLLEAAPGVIPLDQVIVSGGAGSDFSAAATTNPMHWRLVQVSTNLVLTDLVGDRDSDQLPDYWETLFFMNRTNAVAGSDDDGDNLDNVSEFIADTVPTDAGSVLQMTGLSISNGQLLVSWQGGQAALQQIEYTAIPAGTGVFWSVLQTNLPDTALSGQLAHLASSQAVYRIRVSR